MGVLQYDRDQFLLDGKPFRILSGSMHYFRTLPEQWEDRLTKLRACGFNTVETYTCWNLHEPREGEFHFDGLLDVERFVTLAESLGLYVILRPGPYICAEWEFGGLPAWLLADDSIRLRCNDPAYVSRVRRYYRELFSRLAPHLSTRGGNILMVQIENEYGSYGNDHDYLRAIVDIYRECGVDCLLFTSDGPADVRFAGGALDGYLATANFGSRPEEAFTCLRAFRPDQPLMCCEYWNGWFDHWYEPHHARPGDEVADVLDRMLSAGASVNFYMFHGGTNFSFWNGANDDGVYLPTVTSYDYDAPLTEAGDLTPKYEAVKRVLEKHFGPAPRLEVRDSRKAAYGPLRLTGAAPLFDNLDALSKPVFAAAPLSMEKLGQNYGYVLYTATLTGPFEAGLLEVEGLHDRGLCYLDGEFLGCLSRSHGSAEIRITLGRGQKARLDILVENMGRVNYGTRLYDRKGILGGVRLDGQYQFGWEMRPLPMESLSSLCYGPEEGAAGHGPVFLRGALRADSPADTFLRLDGFRKGFVTVNGFNIGRYFNAAGPQKTLYVPAPLLHAGENEIVVFESDGYDAPTVLFTDTPDLG